MSERAEKLKAVWNELSAEEREELFEYFESQQADEETFTPEEWQEAWIDEINRRVADGEAGRTTCVPADEFMKQMKAKYG
jgi:putative addiction module component (TIGR02574 family)